MNLKTIITSLMLTSILSVYAQTVDTSALQGFTPSVVKATYEICAMTPIEASKQVALAKALEKEDAVALQLLSDNGGFLSNKNKSRLAKMREDALVEILSDEQLRQYYRGVYNAEAQADGVKMRNMVASKMHIGYQDGKFINFCFYKIGLEKRVLAKIMKAKPEKAKAAIDKMTREQLDILEQKSGLRISPDGSTCERVRSVAIK